jgi:hypothetical protein
MQDKRGEGKAEEMGETLKGINKEIAIFEKAEYPEVHADTEDEEFLSSGNFFGGMDFKGDPVIHRNGEKQEG